MQPSRGAEGDIVEAVFESKENVAPLPQVS